jgi:hypothetical protein
MTRAVEKLNLLFSIVSFGPEPTSYIECSHLPFANCDAFDIG